jgi:hypothetical protein
VTTVTARGTLAHEGHCHALERVEIKLPWQLIFHPTLYEIVRFEGSEKDTEWAER